MYTHGYAMQEITIIKENRRSVVIQILPDGEVVVKAPRFTPDFIIHQFVKTREAWIEKHKKKQILVPKIINHKHRYVHGESFLFLGEVKTLSIGSHPAIAIEGSRLLFPEFLSFRIKKELSDWYQKKARTIITETVMKNAEIMGANYTEIYFSDTKSKWGSCSVDNRLQFNWRLIMAPYLVLNYVVVHELVHTVEKNHSQAFWRKVERYTPSYRQHVKWLKQHGSELIL